MVIVDYTDIIPIQLKRSGNSLRVHRINVICIIWNTDIYGSILDIRQVFLPVEIEKNIIGVCRRFFGVEIAVSRRIDCIGAQFLRRVIASQFSVRMHKE